jgi:hypothetical protein
MRELCRSPVFDQISAERSSARSGSRGEAALRPVVRGHQDFHHSKRCGSEYPPRHLCHHSDGAAWLSTGGKCKSDHCE